MSSRSTGYPAQGGGTQQKVNEWRGIGVIRSRSQSGNDPIQYYAFTNGGGASHFNLAVTEESADQMGNARTTQVTLPVNVYVNKNITAQMLMGITPGMKVKIVGRLKNESYTNREGQQRTRLCVDAHVMEIIEMPAVGAPAPQQGGYQRGAYVPQGGYPQQGQMPGGYPVQGPQQAPQQGGYQRGAYVPQGGYPQQGQMPGGYPVQGPQQAPQQGGYQGRVSNPYQTAFGQQAGGPDTPPPYYRPAAPAQGQMQAPPAQGVAPQGDAGDLPAELGGVPVRDINV